jgi:hypothetical protein
MWLIFINSSIICFYFASLGESVIERFPLFIKLVELGRLMEEESFLHTNITLAPWSAKYIPQKTDGANPSNYNTRKSFSIGYLYNAVMLL